MTDHNPYAPPAIEPPASTVAQVAVAEAKPDTSYTIYTGDAVGRRYGANIIDDILAVTVTLLLCKLVGDRYPAVLVAVFLSTYWLYYFLGEALFGRTLGKFAMGLMVVRTDGRSTTWKQSLIRTLFRLIEVNPILLGGLPAGISIITSRKNQRIGDKVAGTIVARASRVKHWRKAHPAK